MKIHYMEPWQLSGTRRRIWLEEVEEK